MLTRLGADVDEVLAAVDLQRADFDDPEGVMPYLQLENLLVECERRTGCEHFGLLLCEATRLDDMGLPGRVARCAATVGDGLSALARQYNQRRGGGILNLVDAGNAARFVFAIAMPGSHDTRQYQLGAVTIAYNVLRDLCGPHWQAGDVRLAFRRPAATRPLQRHFCAPLRFDADETSISFDRGWLGQALPPVAESFRWAVAAEVREARERAPDDFPGLVRDAIRRQVSRGRCSVTTVSAALSLHRRNLERRLERHGTSYGALHRSVQWEIAQHLLLETDMSVQQIGEFLRFSSAANFATAFRRWSGRTPTEFRAANR
ncbi:MAG TPA: AraC family transcriptional regulator [Steroidobacteraceae bacterium]